MDWREKYRRRAQTADSCMVNNDPDLINMDSVWAESPNNSRFVDTWAGTIDTQLYGDNLNNLCTETSNNIDNLKYTMARKPKGTSKHDPHMKYVMAVDPKHPLKSKHTFKFIICFNQI